MQNAGNRQGNSATEYFRLKNKWAGALQKRPDVVLETIIKQRNTFLWNQLKKRFSTTSLDLEHVCNHIQRINLQKRHLFCYNFMKRINRPLEKVPSSNFMFSQKKKKKAKWVMAWNIGVYFLNNLNHYILI